MLWARCDIAAMERGSGEAIYDDHASVLRAQWFLVIGSAIRLQSLRTFLAFRGLRIAPALISEVLLSSLNFRSRVYYAASGRLFL
jgi:hypothetical protein